MEYRALGSVARWEGRGTGRGEYINYCIVNPWDGAECGSCDFGKALLINWLT